jgi:hypothetical protein
MRTPEPVAREGGGRSPIPASLQGFFALADAWDLSTDEQIRLLGSPGRSTFFKWKKEGGSLPNDTLERILLLLGIYKALEICCPTFGGRRWRAPA